MKITRHYPTLSHLFFADDVLLFLKADTQECKSVLEVLDIYCRASGQQVNFDKSSVQFSTNVQLQVYNSICALSGLKTTPANAKYLGLPSFWGRSKAEAFQFIIEKVLSKLQGWKSKLLSQAGKEILIKAVVQAIPSYAMACFAFPKWFCTRMKAYISKFWWGGDPEGRGIHWINWDLLALSKFKGGLGFRDFKAFNLALLARQGWRLLKYPNSFCARILQGIYFPHSSFLEAVKGHRASWAWASILQGRNVLMEGLRWQMHSGANGQF